MSRSGLAAERYISKQISKKHKYGQDKEIVKEVHLI